MALKQTRGSISINGDLLRRLRAYSREVNEPFSRIAERAIEAVLSGTAHLKVKPVPPTFARPAATCAICAGPADPNTATLQPLGRGDSLVTVCIGCNELPVTDERYSFSGGVTR